MKNATNITNTNTNKRIVTALAELQSNIDFYREALATCMDITALRYFPDDQPSPYGTALITTIVALRDNLNNLRTTQDYQYYFGQSETEQQQQQP